MSELFPINPKPFLTELLNHNVCVKLKWGIEYKGILIDFDKYMNIRLNQAEEYINGDCKGLLGEILIRCNNVLYVKELSEENNENIQNFEESN